MTDPIPHNVLQREPIARDPEATMPVTRCVCHNLSFDELKRRSDAEGLSFEELKARTRCATGCGMCEPYIQLMMLTGETRFRVLNSTIMKIQIQKHLAQRAAQTMLRDASATINSARQTA